MRLFVITLLLLVAKSQAQVISNFSDSDSVNDWTFYNGAEFPGAQGTLSWVSSSPVNYALLTYDFTHPTEPVFNPQYVSASVDVSVPFDSSMALSLDFQCANASLTIRFVDSTYQTFQIDTQTAVALEQVDNSFWYRGYEIPFPVNCQSYWGGQGDGVFHGPLTSLSLLAQGEGAGSTGSISFTNIEIVPQSQIYQFPLLNVPTVVPARTSTPFVDRTGVNIHFTTDDQAMDIISSVGINWIRMDFGWSGIEWTVGTYDFSGFDDLVAAAEQRGLHVLAIFDYGHPYWTGGDMLPPLNSTAITAFGNYVFATVQHYLSHDVIFEVWNEPDIDGFWGGTSNVTQYAPVLMEAIRRARDASSTKTVLTGGMSNPYSGYPYWDYLQSVNAGAGASGLGSHLYVNAGDIPEVRWPDILKLGPIAKDITGGVLWCTEWGFSTTEYSPIGDGHEPVGRQLQAEMAVRQMILGWWADLPLLVYYDIRDDGTDPLNTEHNFGLLANDYTDKPSMSAVRVLFSVASTQNFVGLLTWSVSVPGLHVAHWENSSTTTFVAWLEQPINSTTVQLSVPISQEVSVISMFGVPVSTSSDSTNTYVDVSTTGPIYIFLPHQSETSNTSQTVVWEQVFNGKKRDVQGTVPSSSVIQSWISSQLPTTSGVAVEVAPTSNGFQVTSTISGTGALTMANSLVTALNDPTARASLETATNSSVDTSSIQLLSSSPSPPSDSTSPSSEDKSLSKSDSGLPWWAWVVLGVSVGVVVVIVVVVIVVVTKRRTAETL